MRNNQIEIKIDPSNSMAEALEKAETALTQSTYAKEKGEYVESKEVAIETAIVDSGEAKINASESLSQATTALTTANQANSVANDASIIANEAKITSTNTQNQLNNIVIESGTSDAETIQARGGFPVLSERLDSVTAQLDETSTQITDLEANKADKTEVNSLATEKADKTYVDTVVQGNNLAYKESYDTLALLQTAYPTGDTYNHAVLSDDMIYTYVNSVWTSTGIQANGTGISTNSVTPDKTTFASVLLSENIFNKTDITTGYSVSAVNGTLYVKTAFSVSGLIEVKPNTLYDASSMDRYAEYDANEVFVQGSQTKPFTTSATTKYIRIAFADININTLMVVEGSALPLTYVPYSQKTKINNLYLDEGDVKPIIFDGDKLKSSFIVTEENPSFLYRDSVNMFNKDTVTLDKRLSTINTTVDDVNNTISDYIEVLSESPYSVTEGSYTHFFDANKQFISGHGTGITTFTTPSLTKYIKITVRKVKLLVFMLVPGSVVPLETDYVPYNKYSFTENINIAKDIKHFDGKALAFNGDSIVENGSYMVSEIKNRLGFASATNYGIGGTAYTVRTAPYDANAISVRYTEMADTFDVICAMAGTNDFSSIEVTLGTMADRGTNTFYGALHTTFSGLVAKYPTKKLAVFTMPPRYNQHSSVNGETVFQYADAIMEVASYYSIPSCDMLRNSQLRPWDATNKALYISDGLHPETPLGYDLMLPRMVEFLKTV